MKNKNLNLSLGLVLIVLNSNILLMQVAVLLGLYLILTVSKDLEDNTLNNLVFALAITIISTMFVNMNLVSPLFLTLQIILNIVSALITLFILRISTKELLKETIISDESSMETSISKSIKRIVSLDFFLIIVALIKLLALYTNINFIYNLANALNKESTAYAILYLPIILKYLASKPYRDLYLSIKDQEVIE